MNKKAALIFFTFFFGIYALINYYIYIRAYQCIPDGSSLKTLFNIVFLTIASSFIFGKILEHTRLFRLSRPVSWISSFWLGAMLYFFIVVLLTDIVRLADSYLGFLPVTMYYENGKHKEIVLGISILFVFLLLLAGFINARSPRIKKLTIPLKKSGSQKTIRIAAVSDIHIGILFGKKRVARLARRLKKLQPEVILFIGDLIDEVPTPVIEMDMGSPLRELKTPLGKYAITGNHEFIGGITKCAAYIESLDIKLLRDEMILIDNAFYLAGRDDKDAVRFIGKKRKPLTEVIKEREEGIPVILMDHQPFRLNEAEDLGVNLQLSGHTHHGQLWPLNYITKAIFELSWGYLKKGSTHYYVSCGYGTWVPQIRIGNRPEILNIELSFS